MSQTASMATSVGDVRVVGTDGDEHIVAVRRGARLMPALKSAKVGIIGMCGGHASCGTCHVYVAEEWRQKLGEPTGDERDMLDELESSRPESRLACQLTFTEALDGLRLTAAPHD